MRLLRYLLALVAVLLWTVSASAQYNPTNPPEPGVPGDPTVEYTLTTKVVPAGASTNYKASGKYLPGTSVGMYAYTASNYNFQHWEDEDGNIVSEISSFNYTMPARDITLIARFVYNPSNPSEPSEPVFKDESKLTFKVSPADGGYFGSTYSGTYTVGTTHSFTAYSNSNFSFVNWTQDGLEIGTSRTLNYTVPSGDHTLTANFVYTPSSPEEPGVPRFPHSLSVKANPSEATSTLSGSGEYYMGDNVSIRAYANSNFILDNWTDQDGNVVSATSYFTYMMPDHPVTLTANYTYNPTSPAEPGVPNPDGSVGTNMVAWPRFGMYDDTHVLILCETEGSIIHYTLDGSDPTASSPVYTEPVFVPSNLLVKAIAFKEGMEDSPIRSYQVTAYHAGTPVFYFENRNIVIRSETEDAIIRYTTDFSNPTEESEVFTTPFEPEENCRIKAYASKEGLTDSPISYYVYRRAEHTLPAPSFEKTEDDQLVIIPPIEGGQTFYTINSLERIPNPGEWNVYLRNTANWATPMLWIWDNGDTYVNYTGGEWPGAGMEATNVEGELLYKYTFFPDEVFQLPMVVFNNGQGTQTLDLALINNSIYDCDGNIVGSVQPELIIDPNGGPDPTTGSTLYTGPFDLPGNCIVKAFTTHFNYFDSPVGSYISTGYKVEPPVYDFLNPRISFTAVTPGSEVRYTMDGSDPIETSILYQGPITLTQDCVLKARAFKNLMEPSEVVTFEYVYADYQLPVPTAYYSKHCVWLECEDELAEIRYRIQAQGGTSMEMRYDAPIPVEEDCLIMYHAEREFFNRSEMDEYRFVLADYQEEKPIFEPDYMERRLVIRHPEGGELGISFNRPEGYDIEGESDQMIEVETWMNEVSAVAKATDEDRYDSEPAQMPIEFHLPPVFEYDGYVLKALPNPEDPYQDEAYNEMIFVTEEVTNPSPIYGEFPVENFGIATATIFSDHTFRSEETRLDVDYFNCGDVVGVRNGIPLFKAFENNWWQTHFSFEELDHLQINGEISWSDLSFLSKFKNIRCLDILADIKTSGSMEGALKNLPLESVRIHQYIPGLLKDLPRLSSLYWYSDEIPQELLDEIGNPNLLKWVPEQYASHTDVENVVTYKYKKIDNYRNRPFSIYGAQGKSRKISLQPGYPFNIHGTIEADSVIFTKEFWQTTKIDVCQGWETIILPFTPEVISHEREGAIQPFTTWAGTDYEPRPFWLYSAGSDGWHSASSIEAFKPYIISMPNNPTAYLAEYNIPGKVTFAASGVTLKWDEMEPEASEWFNSCLFTGTFMPVEQPEYGRILSLNNEPNYDGVVTGDHFGPQFSTLPFEAYVWDRVGTSDLPVFGDWSGLLIPEITPDGILIETPAPGSIRLTSDAPRKVTIYTLTGAMVRQLSLKAGESETVEGLEKGLYIVAGRKIMVR